MTNTFYAICVARHAGAELDLSPFPRLDPETPPNVKAGFRQCFWRVFAEGRAVPVPSDAIDVFGTSVRVQRAFLFGGRTDRSSDRQVRDVAFVLELSLEDDTAGAPDAQRDFCESVRLRNPGPELGMLEQLVAALGDSPLGALLGSLDHGDNRPSFKFHVPAERHADVAAVAPYLLAFYHLAIVLLYRIERAQWDVRISSDRSGLDLDVLDRITANRITLIGLDRDFLTLNRSESVLVTRLATEIEESLNLRPQYARALELNASMEQHLANVTGVSQAISARSTGRAIGVLTLLGVPLSVIGTVLSYWSFTGPQNLVGTPLLRWLLAVSFMLPVAVLGVAFGVTALARTLRAARCRPDR
jgi:hypothetical protein